MKHYHSRIYFMLLFLCAIGTASAQKAEREALRKGNRSYKHESYVEAEVSYRKALETNPFSTEALYNLGNTLALQGKGEEALAQYEKAAQRTTNPNKLSMIYHNIGDIYMASSNYAAAVEAFKESLRKESNNDRTRYNLALAQKLLKENPPQEQEQEQNQKQDEQDQQAQNKDDQNKDTPDPEEDRKDKMSKENAEQLLKAALQDEQRLREQMKQEMPTQGGRPEKDW